MPQRESVREKTALNGVDDGVPVTSAAVLSERARAPMNLPNMLTLARIFFVPLLVAAMVSRDFQIQLGPVLLSSDWLALMIFLAAAATDLLDGYLARRWGQITTIGTLLDPIADKLLISSALVALVQVGAVAGWPVILIIGREFAVSGLRSIAAAEGYTIKASDIGKTKMLAQVLAISMVLLSLRHPWFVAPAAWAMWVVVAFAIVSAVDYFRKFWRKIDGRIKRRRRQELLAAARRRRLALRQSRSDSALGGVRETT